MWSRYEETATSRFFYSLFVKKNAMMTVICYHAAARSVRTFLKNFGLSIKQQSVMMT